MVESVVAVNSSLMVSGIWQEMENKTILAQVMRYADNSILFI